MGPIERRLKKKRAQRNVSFAISAIHEATIKVSKIVDKKVVKEMRRLAFQLKKIEAELLLIDDLSPESFNPINSRE